LAAIVIGAVLLAFSATAVAQYEDYIGSDACAQCHEDNWNLWQRSGHPYKLMKGELAKNRPIPLPVGFDWSEISYVIGGYKWKSRYMDENGYIITQDGSDEGGNTQYNYMTNEWVDYHTEDENGVRPYSESCGTCHTSAWITNPDPTDLTHNQDGLAGIHGTFVAGGVHCEECHGPGADFSFTTGMLVDTSAEACGRCHYRSYPPGSEMNGIPANGSATAPFIKHHEQYNEHLASPHASMDCTRCHNPHSRGEFSIWKEGERVYDGTGDDGKGAQCGVDCHSSTMASYAETSMYDYGVTCTDCHMSLATKSGQVTGPHQGDVMTHIFSIDTDPMGNMFNEDNTMVALDDDGKAAVTMDYACQRCHETATLEELGRFADNFHSRPMDSLEGLGLDPGLSGHWNNPLERDKEGLMVDVAYDGLGDLFFFSSFYARDPAGNLVWLFVQGNAVPGSTEISDLVVATTTGGTWGPDYNPDDVDIVLWGTGYVAFPTCKEGSVILTPNAEKMAEGYTEIAFDISRELLEPGVACPTFVNNDGAMAAK